MSRLRLLLPLLAACLLLAAPAAHGAGSGVVVSQVYAGGGNSGATYTNDFVELLNAGSASVDLSGWTIQYATAAGTSWQPTPLSGSIGPGQYYLVELASGAAGGALPPADATGTTNLSTSGGKVALVSGSAALTCGATAGSCSSVAAVEDLVGYGSAASDYEGSGPAPALTSSTAAVRAGGGCTDTGSNAADFTAGTPSARSSSSPAASCGGSGSTPSSGASADAGVDVDIQPVLSIALERPSVSFGSAVAGDTPPPISERVTVVSNDAAGYMLTVHRSAFTPADLPLGVASSAPGGAEIGAALAGGARAAIPIAPAADLTIGTSSAPSAAGGDEWPTTLGFTGPLPVVPAGHYTATVTYTLIGR